uniref:Abasic site processing protein HMCES n=1 Tax=Romanomermis culicivorax TaxID=13658 RepID=A0A915JV78_ROMCU
MLNMTDMQYLEYFYEKVRNASKKRLNTLDAPELNKKNRLAEIKTGLMYIDKTEITLNNQVISLNKVTTKLLYFCIRKGNLTNESPVLISAQHHEDEEFVKLHNSDQIVLQPMKWGLVSSWLNTSNERRYGYRMINARAETLTQKPTFKRLLKRGRRCAVVVDGDVEKEDQDRSIAAYYRKSWSFGEHNGRKLMFLAGLFDINYNLNDEPLFSYVVITVNSARDIRFIHNRMPAVLLDEDEVWDWITSENVDSHQAMELLQPVEDLAYHRVSNVVNNTRFKGAKCVRPLRGDRSEATLSTSED